mgnify:CR=1 FL=1
MNKNNIITGIDVGTTKIVAAVAEKKDGTINIIGIGISNSDGLNKGIVREDALKYPRVQLLYGNPNENSLPGYEKK